MLVSPESQCFSVFGFSIYYYGVILAFAIFVGITLADKIAKKYYNQIFVYEQAFYLVIMGLLGARLYFCLLTNNCLHLLNIRNGGLSIHGAIIAGVLTLYFFSKKYKFSFLKLCDIYAVSLPLAQSIGRWGNYINSEAFGKPTEYFLKLYIAPYFRPLEYENYKYFHPTFLYESILDLLLFFVLYKLIIKKHKNAGFISGIYLISYAVIRSLIEPLRLDCTSFLFNIPVPIIISVIMACVGVYLIKVSSK